MLRFTLIITLLLTCWLAVGILSAKGANTQDIRVIEKEIAMALHVSMLCEKRITINDIVYVGADPDGRDTFYLPVNASCEWTGFPDQVWARDLDN